MPTRATYLRASPIDDPPPAVFSLPEVGVAAGADPDVAGLGELSAPASGAGRGLFLVVIGLLLHGLELRVERLQLHGDRLHLQPERRHAWIDHGLSAFQTLQTNE